MPRPAVNLPLAVTVLSWGFNFVAVKVLQPEMSVTALSLLRFSVMWALLAFYCLARGESLRYRREDALHVLAVGFASMGVYMILFLEGLARTGAAEGAIVLATSPIFTYLFSCWLKYEQFISGALIGTVLAFLGVGLVVMGGAVSGSGSIAGDLLVLSSAVTWSACTVLTRPLLGKYSPTQMLAMSMPGALPLLLPYALPAVLHTDYAHISLVGWTMFGQIAVVSGVIAFACFYAGLHQIGPGRATLYQYFVPPTAALFSWLILHKPLGPLQFAGLGVVLTGVFLASRARQAAKA